MKICVVTQQFRNVISGVGLHANNLTASLLQKGHDVTLIVPEDQAPLAPPSELTVVTVKKPRFNQNQARWVSLSVSFNAALKKLESQSKFDLIHFTDARESFFCSTRAPMIGHINDTYSAELWPLREYEKNYPDWLLRWLYYRVVHLLESLRLPRLRLLVVNSHYTASVIKRVYPKTAPKVRLCYKSVDVERYRAIFAARQADPPDPNQPLVLFVGSNMYRKGVPDLIKAAPAVLEAFPQARFVLVGQDKHIDALKDLCARMKVDDHFDFVGWQSQQDLLAFYQRAAVFAMPSLTEALGVTFLEAMAAGVPVIGTNVGGIPEVIQHDISGLIVPPLSPSSLAVALQRLLADDQLRERLTRNAYESLGRFDVASMMNCTFNLYQEIQQK